MEHKQLNLILRHVRQRIGRPAAEEAADSDLLARFSGEREEAAFAELMHRHGAMVLGVCRRILDDPQDAEDAFQATFLVLVRKAASVRHRASVASWLYGVALRVAQEARSKAARRRARERQVEARCCPDHSAEVARRELRTILDEELRRLPEKYRTPVVLHYLEGQTKEATARQLGWTEGTVSGRLARARDLLRKRLARRGVALSAGALATALAQPASPAAVPRPLADATLQAALVLAAGPTAAGAIGAPVLALTESGVTALALTKLKTGAALLLLIGLLAAGTGLAVRHTLPAALAGSGSPEANPSIAHAANRKGPPPAAAQEDDPNGAPAAAGEDDDWPEAAGKPGRLDRAIAGLRGMTHAQWDAHWQHDLDLTQQPAGPVLRDLVHKLGLELELTPAQELALKQPLTLHARGRSRLELLEEVCHHIGCYPVYPGGTVADSAWDKKLRLKDGARPWPVAFAGPFLVEVKTVEVYPRYATGELGLHVLAVDLPPAVALPLQHGDPLAVEKVMGPQGQDLRDLGWDRGSSGTQSYTGLDQTVACSLKSLLRGVPAIQTVAGKVRLPIASRVESVNFRTLGPGTVERVGNMQVTLRAIKPSSQMVNGNEQRRQDFDFLVRGAKVNRLWGVGFDADGELIGAVRRNYGGWGTDAEPEGYYVIGFTRPPASITLKVVAALESVEYPFRLSDLPLPAHGQMPEQLPPARFPGHAEPVAVECVNVIPGKKPFGQVELKAVNHCDKDVRSLNMQLYYLDAQGQTLKEWPASERAKGVPGEKVPVLVGGNDTAVFRASSYGMPPETKSVRVVVKQVDFADAGTWRAGRPRAE